MSDPAPRLPDLMEKVVELLADIADSLAAIEIELKRQGKEASAERRATHEELLAARLREGPS
jgi:hypothetical protein